MREKSSRGSTMRKPNCWSHGRVRSYRLRKPKPKGTAVVRIVRLDRLKVQGFIGAEHLPASVQGRKVRIEIPRADGSAITLESTVAFVSPEVNPINKQRPVWAEIDNESLLLSPGMKAEMTILIGNASARTE